MACFLVPLGEAVVTSVAAKIIGKKKKERKSSDVENSDNTRRPFAKKLRWLTNMLWGGSALLAFEHLWHGEIVPWFPFLTAAEDPGETAEMLHEMATVGVTMAVLVTVVWAAMVGVSYLLEKRYANTDEATKEGATE